MANNLYDLNLQFFEALNDIFKINQQRSWEDLSKRVNMDTISQTYKVYGEIFPLNIDRYHLLPKNKPSDKLTSIFHGNLDGLSIINNIARYSIYTDEIIVFHPLDDPNIIHPEINPISKPNLWRYEFLDNLYFYIVIQKWVKSGIVHLIHNPFNYDNDAQRILTKQAKKRVAEHDSELNDSESIVYLEEMMLEKMKTSSLNAPIEVVKQIIQMKFPHYSNEKVNQLAQSLKEDHDKFPLKVDFGNLIPQDEISITKSGANIEEVNALCQLTGANSYTTQKIIRKQLELIGHNTTWTKFSALYSGVNLTYLDNVDTSLALEIRKQDKLRDIRVALRSLSSFIDNAELSDITEAKTLEFNDKISYEIKKSEQEWQSILDDARKKNFYTLTGTTALGLIIDPTKIIIPSITIPSTIAITEYFKKRNLSKYRTKDPMSVFVDLKNERQSFFSNLRNCIL